MPQNFTYTKDDGSTSNRVLHAVSKPPAPNVRALDLSEFDTPTATVIADLYDTWVKEVLTPYNKAEAERRKVELQEFDAYLLTRGIKEKPLIKSFKVAGLKEVLQ